MIRFTKERCTLEVASLHNLYIFYITIKKQDKIIIIQKMN